MSIAKSRSSLKLNLNLEGLFELCIDCEKQRHEDELWLYSG